MGIVNSEGVGWISADAVLEDVEERQRVVKARSEGLDPDDGSWIPSANAASWEAICREWFFASVGIEKDRDLVTWYYSRAPIGIDFLVVGVVSWTHWSHHSVFVRIKDALEREQPFPKQMEYGPPHLPAKIMVRPVGPMIQYFFRGGALADYKFHWTQGSHTATTKQVVPVQELSSELDNRQQFGLRDIVELMDWNQSEQIRGKMAGICLLTGGPGVGKTSVALHRIPYLLREQREVLAVEAPSCPTNFFDESTIQVIVWKEHLVRYLKDLLAGLYCHTVPVRHVDKWATDILQQYVDIGRGAEKYRIQPVRSEDDRFERMKIGLGTGKGTWCGVSPEMIEDYLTGTREGQFNRPAAIDGLENLRELIETVNENLVEANLSPLLSEPTSYRLTASGIEATVAALRNTLDNVEQEIAGREEQYNQPRGRKEQGSRPRNQRPPRLKKEREGLSKQRERVTQFRESELTRLGSDHVATLHEFYRSDVFRLALAPHFQPEEIDSFHQRVDEQARRRLLSRGDRYVLLWIVQVLTRGTTIDKARIRPLPLYSHTVVDEAQYYHPLVLRLLVDLAKPDLQSMTIVGDLEQRVSQLEGLDEWDDIGIPRTLITHAYKLKTNYRWSCEVFRFLDIFRKRAQIQEELTAPPRWGSGAGFKPEVVCCDDLETQVEWIVERIERLRQEAQASSWSIAVVVSGNIDEWCERLLEELKACGTTARWAEGQDVHGSIEPVILTTYESVVGLEFDAVFLPRFDEVAPAGILRKDVRQAVWVALTRARQFLAVSHTSPVAIFNAPEFAAYRHQA